jgi:hypothetical protein
MRRITRTCYWLVGVLVVPLAGVALAAPASRGPDRFALSMRVGPCLR